jgi:hypothetical protein
MYMHILYVNVCIYVYLHVEALCPLSHLLSNAAAANNSNSLTMQLSSHKLLTLPFALHACRVQCIERVSVVDVSVG